MARACTKGTATHLTLCFGRCLYLMDDAMQYSARLWMFELGLWHCKHILRLAGLALDSSGVANSRLLPLAHRGLAILSLILLMNRKELV